MLSSCRAGGEAVRVSRGWRERRRGEGGGDAHLVLTRRTVTAVADRHAVTRTETAKPMPLHDTLEALANPACGCRSRKEEGQ